MADLIDRPELRAEELDVNDPAFPLIVAACLRKESRQ